MAPGDRFGHYELRRSLGRGGMGEVWEAYDTVKDRTVALKLLHAELANNPDYRERFRRESHAAARLQEPHVIPIHDWGEIDGTLYIDMRLVRGVDLRSLIRSEGGLAPARAVGLIGQVAGALDAAHASGLVHRDVKPENVIVTPGHFAYLVDFGIAQSATDPKLTVTGSAVGSYAYMAPERFDDRKVGPAADVYSLACVLYEELVGTVPFPSSTISSAVKAHLMADPPRPSARPGVPVALDAVIARGMAKDPEQRYRSAGEFAAAAVLAASAPSAPPASGVPASPAPGGPNTRTDPTRVNTPIPPPTAVGPPAFTAQPTFTPSGYTAPPPGYPASPSGYTAPPPSYAAAVPSYTPPAQPTRSTAVPVLLTLLVVAVLAVAGVAAWLVLDRTSSDNTTDPVVAQPTTVITEPGGRTVTITSEVTVSASTTAAATTQAPFTGQVTGSDNQGFLSPAGARCDGGNPAVVIGRSESSLVVICRTGVGRYYYKGVRVSDGLGITLDDPVPSGDGFVATNPKDGTRYEVSSSGLVIYDATTTKVNEAMIEYAHR